MSHSAIPDYGKALRVSDLDLKTVGQLKQMILDLDHKKRALERNLIRSLTIIHQTSAGMIRTIENFPDTGGGA